MQVQRHKRTETQNVKITELLKDEQTCNTRKTDVGLQYTGWPKKVSHYNETSLNRIKTCHYG